MARPTKQGIDYFPLDTQFDDKIELLIADKGSDTVSVLITIWQLIYRNDGYFIADNSDLYLLIRRRIMLETVVIEDIVKSAVEREIFDKKLKKKYNILTSKAIQKRYFIAASKKKKVNVCGNYLCSGIDSPENATLTRIDSIGNATNVNVEEDVKGKGKEEEEKPPFILPDWIDQNLWKEFLKVQKKKKTDFAKTLAVGKLEKFKADGYDISEIIKYSIEGGWSSFFKPKQEKENNGIPKRKGNNEEIDYQADADEVLRNSPYV